MTLFKNIKRNKFFLGVCIFFAVVFFLIIVIDGWNYYDQWKGEKRIDELAQELRRLDKEDYERKAADKIGGKTPQETLDLFIQAVENGDYELASKYFVVEKQEKWEKDLEEVGIAKKLNTLLDPLKKVIYSNKGYSFDKKEYNIHNPILVSFILYPSGNWKIEEI
ncbi:hypothetical protein A3B85_03070 [Candidatus Nomurabacteria bacterium RIFCSPHIGHO2_02_FULL_37_13]|uniref:DUF4878 domain-containing protein n=1 Tax=Candidatus Nomurabacteria bacterium RIFCSPHIGHO2_02_FULL_37_13 TaxID=1801750 RepID=A0A1F6W463_9BACT|nr:MAG: hypothetical protein A2640_03235 [Candidatus Nomurabacteria bacterium RIFCSPHIGHO2_01_FULL_36_23]OGI76738.1 MAG: hypothetical protein A3B85_03070 [Candidatus Nomurabacteria bacterium RIFCSPHIGHO2_02_FULL_37_13]OGI88466.1 MAG: hypothetical protein A2906_01170 [Candidatus Nomurabacteria bacterium RIFCSPLOWO2_01_FULL_37_25]